MAQIRAKLVESCPTNTNPFSPVLLTRGSTNITLGQEGAIDLLNQLQKLDSVHDFGDTRGNSLATDSVTKNRENGNYMCDQMVLSFIQKYSFPNSNAALRTAIPPMNIQTVSSFSSPGAGDQPRFVDDIENYLIYCSINNAITTKGKTYGTNFLCLSSKSDFAGTKRRLTDFFSNYRDTLTAITDDQNIGTGKINLIVDTPGDLTKVLKTGSLDDFAYVLTQESAHDSAKSKPTTLSPIVIDAAYGGNGFCEAFNVNTTRVTVNNPNTPRTYTFHNDDTRPGNFESNFSITFTGMIHQIVNKKESFATSVQYQKTGFNQNFDCILNSPVHPTNVPHITKEITKISKNSTITLRPPARDNLDIPKYNVEEFYRNFNVGPYNYFDASQNILDFNFTKKRAGDGLQARICQYVNSGSIKVTCFKQAPKGGSSTTVGNLETNTTYDIRTLILVTIDRVLFSYAIKNDIPVIYSGSNYFIFYNPLGATTPPSLLQPPRGGSFIPRPLPSQKEYNKQEPKTKNKNKNKNTTFNQKGGTDADEFFGVINETPYILFKLLPKVLQDKPNGKAIASTITTIKDEDIKTYYGSGCKILIYNNDKFYDLRKSKLNPNYLINLSREDEKLLLTYTPSSSAGQYQLFVNDSSDAINISNSDFIKVISNMGGFISRYAVTDLIRSFGLVGNVLNLVGLDDESLEQDANITLGLTGGSNKSLLDIYINNLNDSQNLLNNNSLKEDNFVALISYINILNCYEVSFCYDNDIYEQKFNNINSLEVTNCIGLYIMYELLLNDFSEQITKISYKLMEYFINSGDTSQTQNYLSISTDLMEVINYVYIDDTRLMESLNNKTEKQIQTGIINTSDPIFIASKTYFTDLFGRIQAKQTQIDAYLNGTNTDPNIGNYIKNNLSMYGFMNMTNDYFDRLTPSPSSSSSVSLSTPSGVARGVTSYPTAQERLQQISSQKARLQSQPIQPSKSLLKPFQGKTMTMQQLKQKQNIQSAPEANVVYSYNAPNRGANTMGGKYITRKNNNKNRKTRKNRKVNRKHRHIRKTKRNNNKTRKN